jgi:hypothetical protein
MKISQLAALFLAYLLGALPIAASAQPFTISADGREVTDQKTGLIWRRCPEGMEYSNNSCTGTPSKFNHDEALEHTATQANITGVDWRMPSAEELAGDPDRTLSNLKVDSKAFPNTPAGLFWTGSPYPRSTHYAWSVDFTPGIHVTAWYNQFGFGVITVSHLSFPNYVRLVRDNDN